MKNEIKYGIALFRSHWRKYMPMLVKNIFIILGNLWLLTKTTSFFSTTAQQWLQSQGLLFAGLSIFIALIISLPKTSYSFVLSGRDTTIEIRICDLFDTSEGAIVIPTNTTFDTDLNGRIPKAPSVQGKFTRDYYNSNVSHLDLDIDTYLSSEGLSGKTVSKKIGKTKQYEVGTVVQLTTKGRLFYLLALTDISDDGRAVGSPENIKLALARLWYHISEKGDKGEILIPIMGTGHARFIVKREDVIRDIIRSFVASCSSKNYCNKLVIALFPPDVIKYNIDLHDMGTFLEYSCSFNELHDSSVVGVGTSVS